MGDGKFISSRSGIYKCTVGILSLGVEKLKLNEVV